MKTITEKEFCDELERERKGAVRVVAIGIIACVVLVVAFVLLLLANGNEEPKETKYVEAFRNLIGKLNGKKLWDTNPYVIVYEFELVD